MTAREGELFEVRMTSELQRVQRQKDAAFQDPPLLVDRIQGLMCRNTISFIKVSAHSKSSNVKNINRNGTTQHSGRRSQIEKVQHAFHRIAIEKV